MAQSVRCECLLKHSGLSEVPPKIVLWPHEAGQAKRDLEVFHGRHDGEAVLLRVPASRTLPLTRTTGQLEECDAGSAVLTWCSAQG